jgi:hypothetical protein
VELPIVILERCTKAADAASRADVLTSASTRRWVYRVGFDGRRVELAGAHDNFNARSYAGSCACSYVRQHVAVLPLAGHAYGTEHGW